MLAILEGGNIAVEKVDDIVIEAEEVGDIAGRGFRQLIETSLVKRNLNKDHILSCTDQFGLGKNTWIMSSWAPCM